MPQVEGETGEPLDPHGEIVAPACVHDASGGTSPGRPAWVQSVARAGEITPDHAWPKHGEASRQKISKNFFIPKTPGRRRVKTPGPLGPLFANVRGRCR